MSKSATRVISAQVPAELAEKLDQLALRLEQPREWVMKQALSSWIEREEERDRLTWEALADADAGRVVSQQEVEEWVKGLELDGALAPPEHR